MRKLVVVAAVWTVVVFVVGRVSVQSPANAAGRGGGAGTPSGNGDVNGDGMLNIADPVYLCRCLFSGGPVPVPIVCRLPLLPTTGQTKCYNRMGDEIPCDSSDFPGQDGFYHAGCPNEGRFVDNDDGTVTDNCTGLMWQKDTADVNGDGWIDPSPLSSDCTAWRDALQYCDSLDFAGHTDWRLPNVRELESLVDYERVDPSIHPVFGAVLSTYWSSSTYASSPRYGFYVSFNNGSGIVDGKGSTYYIRAVRNAP